MEPVFYILAAVTLGGAAGAVSFRNLVHCALCLVAAFVGLALFFLQLGAQFAGLVQVLVYVGAVAILIVFAVLLTRGGEGSGAVVSPGWLAGLGISALVFGTLAACVLSSPALRQPLPPAPVLTVRQIGEELMTRYVLPLEVIGLLLTAAMIGAAVIAMRK